MRWNTLTGTIWFCAILSGQSFAQPVLQFEENYGQAPADVKFLVPGSNLWLEDRAAILGTPGGKIRFHYLGANPGVVVRGMEKLPGKVSYFTGNNPTRWRTGIPTYERVEYQGLYPGIDLVFYGNQRQLEYDFVIAPGTDLRRIRMAVEGADKLEVDEQGDLRISTGGQIIYWRAPHVYQASRPIEGRYAVLGNEVRFQIGPHDSAKRLVIDPVLAFSTYLGGASVVAADSEGNSYAAGISPDGYGNTTCFITKVNASGTAAIYTVHIGMTAVPNAITVDGAGNAYVAGASAGGLPLAGAIQPLQGFKNGFVTEVNPDGSSVLFSTYLGGSGSDFATGIALDPAGNIYLAGSTVSHDFPTVNPVQSTYGGDNQRTFGGGFGDAFIAKINPASGTVVYSTYLGGVNNDIANGIAADTDGNAYVVGSTASNNFPLANAMQTTFCGGTGLYGESCAFVAKLGPGGSLVYSTFLGNSSQFFDASMTSGAGIAVDSPGNAFVTGSTTVGSPLVHPLPNSLTGTGGYVAELNPAGSALLFSSFVGGAGKQIAIDTAGHVYVTGGPALFPAINAFQPVGGAGGCPFAFPLGCPAAFLVKLDPAAQAVLYSTFLGGNGGTNASGLAVAPDGSVYLTGSTSPFFPLFNALSSTPAGGFLAKISDTGVNCTFTLSATKLSFSGDQQVGSVAVSAPSGCVVTAVPDLTQQVPNWLHVIATQPGTAGGVVSFNVAGNSSVLPRTATLDVAGQTVTVTQAGAAPNCMYTLTPANLQVGYSGGTSRVTVTAPTGCGWQASAAGGGVAITYATGTGTGEVNFTYQANNFSAPLKQTLMIAGQTFTVIQNVNNNDQSSFEPVLTISLPAGFYIAEATLAPGAKGGFWGLEVDASQGQTAGGLDLGGGFYGAASNVSFGAFLLSTAQTVTATLNAQPDRGTTVGLQFLDSQRNPASPVARGAPPVALNQMLQPGFYIVQIVSNAFTDPFPFTFQLGLAADYFVGGLDTGGYIGPGITGFGAFYLPVDQQVTFHLFGRNTYGDGGAGSLILTLRDATRKVLQVVQP